MTKKRQQRYGQCSQEDLAVYARVIEESAGDLRAVAHQMAIDQVITFQMDGAAKFSRGHKLMTEFVGHLEVALAQVLSDQRSKRQQKEVREGGGEGG